MRVVGLPGGMSWESSIQYELLVGVEDLTLAYFPTTRLHAAAVVDFALS